MTKRGIRGEGCAIRWHTPTEGATVPLGRDERHASGPARFRVIDTLVHAIDCASTERELQGFLEDGNPHQIVTVNVDFLRLADAVPAFADLINTSDLAVADGKPVVWMARYLGLRSSDRVTGPDIIEMCARLSSVGGYRIFLLGGEAGMADAAREELVRRFPGINICGAYSPPVAEYPFPPELDKEIVHRLKEASPHILLVAFGCPKQDFWIHQHLAGLGISVSVGIGGSFNFIAGAIPRAPIVMQRLGLEWLYRLCHEPLRLWRRYLHEDLPFLVRLATLELAHRIGFVHHPVLQVVPPEQT